MGIFFKGWLLACLSRQSLIMGTLVVLFLSFSGMPAKAQEDSLYVIVDESDIYERSYGVYDNRLSILFGIRVHFIHYGYQEERIMVWHKALERAGVYMEAPFTAVQLSKVKVLNIKDYTKVMIKYAYKDFKLIVRNSCNPDKMYIYTVRLSAPNPGDPHDFFPGVKEKK